MALFNLKKMRKSGFTLVELLIVVAIIGVLSTIGVPTFRRMIQKAKKSEAKVNLGGLYTAEQAFFAEYGGFGNVINQVGFQIDGNTVAAIYTVGFPVSAGCADPAAKLPAATDQVGLNLNSVFPGYYTGTAVYMYENSVAANQPAVCLLGSVTNGTGVDDLFTASATGVIAPGKAKNSATLTDYDQWSINQARVMINNHDGVF